MPPPAKKTGRDKRTTLALVLCCLALTVPVAGTAISLEITFFPIETLNIKQSDAIINAPHIAVFASTVLALASGLIVALQNVIWRHVSPNNGFVGLLGFGFGIINQIGQLVILGLVYITNQAHLETKDPNVFKFVNGQFDTSGKQFTRESFSCMLGNLYLAQAPWSTNACSEYHYARYTTILASVMAFLLLGISYWPIRKYLFAGKKQPARSKV